MKNRTNLLKFYSNGFGCYNLKQKTVAPLIINGCCFKIHLNNHPNFQ